VAAEWLACGISYLWLERPIAIPDKHANCGVARIGDSQIYFSVPVYIASRDAIWNAPRRVGYLRLEGSITIVYEN
jgi:hypothetical protein